MTEKRFPITRKQHDAINEIQSTVRSLNERLSIVAQTIIAGTDDVLTGQIGITGASCVDGVYTLVLTVPDPSPPPPDTPAAS